MIGCILTGHGSFAPGLMGALEMIAGKQNMFEVIPFLEKDPLETFEAKVAEAVGRLAGECDGVIIFTDLMGGTPFRTAMLAAAGSPKTAVLSGTNLPMLIEGGMMREVLTDAGELADQLAGSGREGISHAKLEVKTETDDSMEEEGI